MALGNEATRCCYARQLVGSCALKEMRRQTNRKRRQADRMAIAHERYDSIPKRYPTRGWAD